MDNERDRRSKHRNKRSERRKYVRYRYPLGERPMVEIKGKTFPVVDISEHGLRIETTPGLEFVDGATVDMTIRFAEGEGLARTGRIARQQGPYAGILLSEAIPL